MCDVSCETSSPVVPMGRVDPHATPTCCPHLSCPVLSCPVLSHPSCPWLPWPIRDSHTETCHADVLVKDRGRCLPQPVSLCVPLSPLLNPALALLTLFSSPPSSVSLSLAAPGAAPLLFIHPKHCWGTPAWVLMHRYGRHHGIGSSSPPSLKPNFLPGMIASSSKLPVSPPCVACCPACCAPAVSLPTNPFCSSSLCLCGCGLILFFVL